MESGAYNELIDEFSCGVVIWVMFMGEYPWSHFMDVDPPEGDDADEEWASTPFESFDFSLS